MIKHQGGCHCGKVRFQTEADPWMVFQCNCMRCRRLLGTVGVFVILSPYAGIRDLISALVLFASMLACKSIKALPIPKPAPLVPKTLYDCQLV